MANVHTNGIGTGSHHLQHNSRSLAPSPAECHAPYATKAESALLPGAPDHLLSGSRIPSSESSRQSGFEQYEEELERAPQEDKTRPTPTQRPRHEVQVDRSMKTRVKSATVATADPYPHCHHRSQLQRQEPMSFYNARHCVLGFAFRDPFAGKSVHTWRYLPYQYPSPTAGEHGEKYSMQSLGSRGGLSLSGDWVEERDPEKGQKEPLWTEEEMWAEGEEWEGHVLMRALSRTEARLEKSMHDTLARLVTRQTGEDVERELDTRMWAEGVRENDVKVIIWLYGLHCEPGEMEDA